MKKILLPWDADNFPKGAFQFIKLLRIHEPVSVKGIFFSSTDRELLTSGVLVPSRDSFVKTGKAEKQTAEQSKSKFIQHCDMNRISHHIHETREKWDKDLFIKESRFADLIVVGQEFFDSNAFDEQEPSLLMQEALHSSECPVVVVPDSFRSVDRIAIAYDGKKTSMFALKQFSYLFPQFTDLPAEIIYIKNEDSDAIPDRDLLQEYANWNFDSLTAFKLHFDLKKYFAAWLEHKKNVIWVTGSYARSAASNLKNSSFADQIIRDHSNVLFIAHG
jgi:hypothetical protein